MTAPAAVIRLEIEARPSVRFEAGNEAEQIRVRRSESGEWEVWQA